MSLIKKDFTFNEAIIKEFLQELALLENRSQYTVRNYQNALSQLRKFIGQNEKLDPLTLRSFAQHLGQTRSTATQNLAISAVSKFLKWAQNKKLPGVIELRRVLIRPRHRHQLKRVFEEDDLKILINYIFTRPVEEQLCFELLYGSGLRISELHGIEKIQFDSQNASIHVLGKGRKFRNVPISPRASELIKQNFADLNPRMFNHWPIKTIRKWVQAWGVNSGLEEEYGRLNPHQLRHAIATHLLRRGAKLCQVQRFLGHKKIKSTERYTHLNSDDLVACYEDKFPIK